MAKQISKHTVKPHIYAEIGSQSRSANKAVDMCLRPQTIGGFSRQMEFCPGAKWRSGPGVIIANHPPPTSTTVAQILEGKWSFFSFFWQKRGFDFKNFKYISIVDFSNKQTAFAAALAVQSALAWFRLAHNNPSCASVCGMTSWLFGAPPFAYENCLGFFLEG